MTHKTLKSDRLWKFSSAGRASALQAEGQRFEPVNFHQTSTYESKCFFFFSIAAGLVICQPAEGQKFEPCNAHQTREIRTFHQTVMGSDLLLFLWKSQKLKNREDCWLWQSSRFFYANALSKAAFPTFRSANALLYYPPHFVFCSPRLLRDSSSNR